MSEPAAELTPPVLRRIWARSSIIQRKALLTLLEQHDTGRPRVLEARPGDRLVIRHLAGKIGPARYQLTELGLAVVRQWLADMATCERESDEAARFPELWASMTLATRRLLMFVDGARFSDRRTRWSKRPDDHTAIRRALERRGLLQVATLRPTDLGHRLARWALATEHWPRSAAA